MKFQSINQSINHSINQWFEKAPLKEIFSVAPMWAQRNSRDFKPVENCPSLMLLLDVSGKTVPDNWGSRANKF